MSMHGLGLGIGLVVTGVRPLVDPVFWSDGSLVIWGDGVQMEWA